MKQPTEQDIVSDAMIDAVPAQRKKILIFGRRMPLPQTRFWRIVLGVSLIVGGLFSFLPILGIWMLPLGLLVLSVDMPFVRRWRRRNEVRWGRWRARRKAKQAGADLADRPRGTVARPVVSPDLADRPKL